MEFVPSAPLGGSISPSISQGEVVLDDNPVSRGSWKKSFLPREYLVRLRLAGNAPWWELQEEENLQVIRDELQGIFGFPYLEVQEGSLYYPIDLAPIVRVHRSSACARHHGRDQRGRLLGPSHRPCRGSPRSGRDLLELAEDLRSSCCQVDPRG